MLPQVTGAGHWPLVTVLMLFGPLATFIANEEVGAGASFEWLVPSLLLLVGVFALSGILFRVLGGRG